MSKPLEIFFPTFILNTCKYKCWLESQILNAGKKEEKNIFTFLAPLMSKLSAYTFWLFLNRAKDHFRPITKLWEKIQFKEVQNIIHYRCHIVSYSMIWYLQLLEQIKSHIWQVINYGNLQKCKIAYRDILL